MLVERRGLFLFIDRKKLDLIRAFLIYEIIILGDEHFQIYGLYRVKEHPYPDDFPRSRTRIILPFNHESENPDYVEDLMSREDAYSKIEKRLTSLNKNTLLFTQNIRKIRWETNGDSGHYSREDDKSNNARMTTITDGEHEKNTLRMSRSPCLLDVLLDQGGLAHAPRAMHHDDLTGANQALEASELRLGNVNIGHSTDFTD